MKRIIIAAAVTLAWVASIVFLPFLTHHATHIIITANAVALGGDTPTWLVDFASLVGVWCLSPIIIFSGAALGPLWLTAIQDRSRGVR